MHRREFITAAGLSTLLVGIGGARAARAPASRTIIALDARLNRCILAHDVAGAALLYADDFILTVSGGGFKTKAAMLADIANTDLHLDVCETRDIEVRVRPGAAVLTGLLLQAGRIGERTFSNRLRVTDTWVQARDGTWRLLAGHASPERPAVAKA